MLCLLIAINPYNIYAIIVTLVLGGIIYYLSLPKDRRHNLWNKKKNSKEQREEERSQYNAQLTEFIKKYGNCSENINIAAWDDLQIKNRLIVFRKVNIIVLNGIEYYFHDIISYSANTNTSYDYAKNRTIWKSNIQINTNLSKHNTVVLRVIGNKDKAYKITSILDMIINKNKKNKRIQKLRKQI